jgi:predicted SAM-dependent methyltransferase
MPVDRELWRRQLNLSNFVNTWCQYRDLQSLNCGRRLLIVGPGQGLDTAVLRWAGYEIVTFDIDETFSPDVIGSVHDLSQFSDRQFDVAIASHVLEHLAEPYLDPALSEIARVAKAALVYLPIAGRHASLRFAPGVTALDLSFTFDMFNYFERPDGRTPRYCDRQHFWEVGLRGWRVRDVVRRLESHFQVVNRYRNRDWNVSYNFVLRSKRWSE